jgi:hypothetical protein
LDIHFFAPNLENEAHRQQVRKDLTANAILLIIITRSLQKGYKFEGQTAVALHRENPTCGNWKPCTIVSKIKSAFIVEWSDSKDRGETTRSSFMVAELSCFSF